LLPEKLWGLHSLLRPGGLKASLELGLGRNSRDPPHPEDPPPQRRITIEHILPDRTKVWSVYIHIMAEKVKVGHIVNTETVIARLMNPVELENFGWEYHHIHLEIMKKLPPFASEFYERKTFTCYTEDEVDEYFYDPVIFLRNHFEE